MFTRRGYINRSLATLGATLFPWRKPLAPEAVIIGSGFGGSVCALRLTQAGIPTLLLEKGQAWPTSTQKSVFSANLPPDHRSTWFSWLAAPPTGPALPILPYAGVLEYADHDGIR